MKIIRAVGVSLLTLALTTPTTTAPVSAGAVAYLGITPARTSPTPTNLSLGDSGYGVTVVQYWLKGHGFSVRVDGDFGSITQKRVITWQHMNGITEDGIVGVETLSTMGLSVDDLVPHQKPKKPSQPRTAPNPPAVDPPAAPPAFSGDVPQLIRDIWPDDTEDWAVAISHRESNFVPTARNSCCIGLFQIHFQANRATLADLGITSPNQLLDAETNVRAALAIFQRSGNSPWLCHGQCKDVPFP
jgi:Putative peptidoglycan binding domain/Transglycosylase SLT domain